MSEQLKKSLELMTSLVRLKYGHLDPQLFAEIEKAEKLLKDAKVPVFMRFEDLPKGARFKYPDQKQVWIAIETYGNGLVAAWNGLSEPRRYQSICSFVDGEEWTLESKVEVLE